MLLILLLLSQNKGDLQTLQKIETEMKQSVADAKARGEAKQGQVEAAKKAVDGEKSGAAGSARGLMAEEEKQQKKEQTGLADAKKKLESDLDVAKKELKKVKQWLLLVPIDWACRVLDSPCVFSFFVMDDGRRKTTQLQSSRQSRTLTKSTKPPTKQGRRPIKRSLRSGRRRRRLCRSNELTFNLLLNLKWMICRHQFPRLVGRAKRWWQRGKMEAGNLQLSSGQPRMRWSTKSLRIRP